MVTRYIGKPVRRVEDLRLITGNGRYTDDIGDGTGALEVAFVRSPHAHARIGDIDVTDALDIEGVVAIYTHEDLEGPAAEPLPVLIPHPSLHAPRTGYALAKESSTTSASRSSWWWPRTVTWQRMPPPGSSSSTTCCRPSSASRRPGPRNTPCTRTSRTTSRRTWCSRSATSTPRWPPRRTGWNST